MSTRIRHWKQTFDFDSPMVFSKRLNICAADVDVVQPGDAVTDALKEHFGKHRLRTWWEGGYIALAEDVSEQPQRPATITAKGKGWFRVTFPDGTVKSVRGKEKAQELIDG